MKHLMIIATGVALTFANSTLAAGDAEKGEKDYKKCKACHMIANGDEVLFKGGKTGPNLYGIVGRTAGAYEDFRYGDSIVAAGQAGLVWTEETLTAYITNPKEFLKETTGDAGAKSKMTFKMKNGEDVAAFLAANSPTE